MYSFHNLSSRPLLMSTPKEIIFEVNGIIKMVDYIKSLGISEGSKILILIDPVIKNLDSIKMLDKSLFENKFHVEWVSEVEYEPSISTAERIIETGRKLKPNIVIGIGGGSTLDLAKILVAGIDNPEKNVRDFIGVEKIPKRATPLILAPSTAGTGSEVSRFAIVSEGERKMSISSRHIIADMAIVDPVLTYTVPPKITAGAGLDALSHAIEAMISLRSSPVSDMFSLQSIKLVFNYLTRAYLRGGDEEARYYMSMAATLAGIPLTMSGMVLGHSIAQTFGPTYKIHHGISCGMTLPYIMDFYLPVMIDKYNVIADILEIKQKIGRYSRALEVVKQVWNLVKELNIPLSLKDIGISKVELEKLAERTLKEWPRPNSPIELTIERILKVYENMYEGVLSRVKI